MQLPKYYALIESSLIIGWNSTWAVAITDVSLNGIPLTQSAPESVAILSDIFTSSYISNSVAPVLRILYTGAEPSTSTDQMYYIALAQSVFNQIRIYLRKPDLSHLDIAKWPQEGALQCTLHFQQI